MSNGKNDVAWLKLFEKHKIIEKINQFGYFEISSTQINDFREARLMTKFDYKSQLPEIFSKSNLSILPISRGGYVISTFETFKKFEKNDIPIQKVEFPNYIETIDYNNITSESTSINCAFVSKIINDFLQEEELYPTVNGRMSSSNFKFIINTKSKPLGLNISNSQIEIDGGFEGINSLSLIEAKNSISDDFLIRQLYYPFRLWKSKTNKPVRNIFLTYTNGIFHLREFVFEKILEYNSIELYKEKKYTISDGSINLEVIKDILDKVSIINEPKLPFPQANSFERVINLCELLNENSALKASDVTENYDFDSRQTNYYTDAARYLGLIEKTQNGSPIIYSLTSKGKQLFEVSIFERQKKFISLILSHNAFKETLELYLKKSEQPTKDEIVNIMKKSNLFNVGSDSTFYRRSSTILSWVDWILSQIEE